jgi:tetratricopeptide (TPR) repeat protein
MLNLDPTLLLLLIASLFILVFGGLGFLRREGLSIQFALEAVGLTVLLVGGSWLLDIELSPFLFLALLYLITMRSRLTVDVANFLVRRDQPKLAFPLYRLSLAWWPDAPSRLIVLTNRGAAQVYTGQIDAAIETLEGVLEMEQRPRLGLKYEAACHYNLGYAYEKKGEDAKAIAQYNETIDVLPGSVYAQAAQAALKRRKNASSADSGPAVPPDDMPQVM